MCSTIRVYQFCYHGNVLVPDLPEIKSFASRLWCSILTFQMGCLTCMIQQAIVKCFLSLKSPKIMKSDWGDGWAAMATQFFCRRWCVARRTISLPSFNVICWKVTEIALLIYLMLYWIKWVTSPSLLFAYFTHFFNLKYLQNQCRYF